MVAMLISVEDVGSITATVRVDVILDDLPDPPSELREVQAFFWQLVTKGFKHGAQTPLWKPLEPLEREELEKTITNLIAKEEDFQDAQEVTSKVLEDLNIDLNINNQDRDWESDWCLGTRRKSRDWRACSFDWLTSYRNSCWNNWCDRKQNRRCF